MCQNGMEVRAGYPWSGQQWCFDAQGHRRSCATSGEDGEFRPGRPWPQPRWVSGSDGILDFLTGQRWFPQVFPDLTSWQGALDVAQGMPGWRLPTIWELESLVDTSRAFPALGAELAFDVQVEGLWSSTSSGYDPAWAWVLYCDKGAVGVGHKSGRHFQVLLVAARNARIA